MKSDDGDEQQRKRVDVFTIYSHKNKKIES